MGRVFSLVALVLLPSLAFGQSLPKVRMAYTSINIQMTPIYMMKELDLPRKQGLDAEILYIPVSSRAVQAALAGEIHFLTSGGIANINANMAGADFVGITATLNTFAFKIIGQPGLREPKSLKGKKIGISRLGGASDFSARFRARPLGAGSGSRCRDCSNRRRARVDACFTKESGGCRRRRRSFWSNGPARGFLSCFRSQPVGCALYDAWHRHPQEHRPGET